MIDMTRKIDRSPAHKKVIALRNLQVRRVLQISETQISMASAVNILKMSETKKLGELIRNHQEVNLVRIVFLRRTWIMKVFLKRKVPRHPYR